MLFLRCHAFPMFSQSSKAEPIMVFASYPVGFPMVKKLYEYTNQLYVCTHFTNPNNKFTNQIETFCKNNNIPYYFPVKKDKSKEEREKEWEQFINVAQSIQKKPKLGIACSYGYMIPNKVIGMFERGMLLAHPSLIPKYRGGSPIFHAIANGEKESGASFMEISPNQFDHGNLLYQVKHPLGQKDSYQKVQKELSELMASEVVKVIQNLDNLRPGKRQSQMDVSGIPPHQLEARIYRDKYLNVSMTAQQIYNWSRALIAPRVKFKDQDIIVFFDTIFIQDPNNQFVPGQLKLKGKHLYMKCKDKFIKLIGWQEITKKPLAIHTFINRFIDKEKYNNQIIFK